VWMSWPQAWAMPGCTELNGSEVSSVDRQRVDVRPAVQPQRPLADIDVDAGVFEPFRAAGPPARGVRRCGRWCGIPRRKARGGRDCRAGTGKLAQQGATHTPMCGSAVASGRLVSHAPA
jgi:hypothetical protein